MSRREAIGGGILATTALITGVFTIYGPKANFWLEGAKAYLGISRVLECKAGQPCPSNMQRFRFILAAIPLAHEVSVKTGVPMSAMIAQAALETGYGSSYLARTHNNYFGIKCNGTWAKCVSRFDTEYVNGQKTGWTSQFRSYTSAAGSFYDYATFLKVNPRYAAAFQSRKDGKEFASRVARAGYATDPGYAKKLHTIIDGLRLEALNVPPSEWKLDPLFCSSFDQKAKLCKEKN
ncbi:glycoside hydrolase family 73 protein [Deinococcus cellulosilyticus]|uniref:Mannosyl-glycoprotein endo-beta-N-acetylglucosamidase-like domain-containing protein n=1 Tax=Deinococcus cellulosilyticus (strain DSM 18568 / NBRC 106333 / KACC 11606 / 5516J-15) TaxID=1223518 RepID=A0A511N8V5_DEIC1|nr:glucosaminidase domain-containing protein [Deinococcus cellulosilyticus]GEM48821.1 hypothetical protein DC3_44560 [Deinococcus cellulosilyticus NBRC 106333 = KACC 11606]